MILANCKANIPDDTCEIMKALQDAIDATSGHLDGSKVLARNLRKLIG